MVDGVLLIVCRSWKFRHPSANILLCFTPFGVRQVKFTVEEQKEQTEQKQKEADVINPRKRRKVLKLANRSIGLTSATEPDIDKINSVLQNHVQMTFEMNM